MELILDFLDGSVSKTFHIPIKSTPFTALRIIYFKMGLDLHTDDLKEFALALSPHNFEWKNIFWLESHYSLQLITQNGLKHVLLLKKHFLINKDLQIAKLHSLLFSLLYNQFYKMFLSSKVYIEENILISLSARLLQSEFSGCEITLQSLCWNQRLSSILPVNFKEDSSLGPKIFHCWEMYEYLCEKKSKFTFLTNFLSHFVLYSYYTYDILYPREAELTILTNELRFSFPSHTEVEIFPTNCFCSLYFSSKKHSISFLHDNGNVLFFSEYIEQIVSILSTHLNLHILCLDDFDTDVDQIQLSSKDILSHKDYLCLLEQDAPFFQRFASQEDNSCSLDYTDSLDCFKELPSQFVFDMLHPTCSKELSSINDNSSTFESKLDSDLCETYDYDENYDILVVPQGLSLSMQQNRNLLSQRSFSHIFENVSISDEGSLNLNKGDYYLDDVPNNPIYSELYDTFPFPFADPENISGPVSYDSISNKSTILPVLSDIYQEFNELGDTYNSHFEIESNSDFHLNRNGSANLFQNSGEGNDLHIYSHYLISSKYCFVSYVLLPNYNIYTELVDIRLKAKTLLLNIGCPIGFWNDFYIYILGCPLVFHTNSKQSDTSNCLNSGNPVGVSKILRNILDLETSFISQNINGSMIFQIVRKSDSVPKKINLNPQYNTDQHYLRCCFSILHCNTPITLQQAIYFASLQYQGYFFHRVSNIESEYCSPWHFISDVYKSVRGISKQIRQEQEKLNFCNFAMVKDALIHQYMNLPLCGYIFFSVKEIRKKFLQHPKLVPIYFGISTTGLLAVHPLSKRVLSSYDFHALRSWKYTSEAFIFKIGMDKEVTAIQTNQGFCISTMISYFIDGILETSSSEHFQISKHSLCKKHSIVTNLNTEIRDMDEMVYESI